MENRCSESYESLLSEISEILVKSNKINNMEEKLDFLKQNEAKIVMFKNKLDEIAEKYLIKESNNLEQNKVSKVLKKIIIQLLNNEDAFENQEESEEYKTRIIDMLSHYENRLMFRLRRSDELKLISECLEYQKDREAYIRAIKNNKRIQQNQYTEKAIRNYINDYYERILFENMTRIIKDDKITLNKREAKKFIKQIDSLEFINKILGKVEEDLPIVYKWMLQRYADTIIPLKVAVYPESLENDKLIVAFLKGEIKNEELYLQIANAIPIEEFESLIFAINFKNTSRIIKEVKLGNLSEKEKTEINKLLEKAGIKVKENQENIEDDENHLVTIQELKEYYDEVNTEELYNEKAKFYKAKTSQRKENEEINSAERKAYAEVCVIIRMMTKKTKEKISTEFIEFIEKNKSKKGNTGIDKNKRLKNQKLRNQTKVLLAIIYRDYMCSEEERRQLIKEERKKMLQKEEREKSLMVIDGLNWYQKLLILIKRALTKRENKNV